MEVAITFLLGGNVAAILCSVQEWSVQNYLAKGAPASKLVMGIPLYARTFKLASAASAGYHAPATGAGAPGTYTGEAGFLSYYEVGEGTGADCNTGICSCMHASGLMLGHCFLAIA
jgi:GH18 family chitinase